MDVRAPFRLLARMLETTFLWMFARSKPNLLEPGEKMLAYQGELDADGNFWTASDRAIYIEAKPTSANRRRGPITTKRIPYEWVDDFSENRGPLIQRTLTITNDRGSTEISGTFKHLAASKLTQVMTEHIARGADRG